MTPATGLAHPHLFVETALTILYEGDIPVGVQVEWIYDDFFSLLLTSDLGIDLDGDLALSAEEEAVLDAAVTAWPEGFAGDLEVRQNGELVPLGDKTDHTMSYEAGIVRETHVRPLPQLNDPNITLQAFDPFYYIAYDLTQPVQIIGRTDCDVAVFPADLDAARALVADLLDGLAPEDVGPDEPFPEVGSEFADKVSVTCG
ncbi:DUF1007 family protein [Cognatiyoonia koreensis]|nr:DUF1007 family protein [Cognatiyoonia koreensis]